MMILTTRSILTIAMGFVLVPAASAQTPPRRDHGFFSVNGAFQSRAGQLRELVAFTIYEEQARFEGSHTIEGGGLVDLSGGVVVWRHLAVGLGFTRFTAADSFALNGRVPDPLEFDRFRDVTTPSGEFGHRQRALHLQAVWMMPIGDKLSVSASVGPSFFTVQQDIVRSVEVRPGTQEVSGVTKVTLDESAVGVNLGVDVTYVATRWIGAGILLRFAGASLDLPTPSGTQSIDLGGFQIGGGMRVRF